MTTLVKAVYQLFNRLINQLLLRLALAMTRGGKGFRKRILVIHLQGIGDYFLYRNFLKEIKDSYPGYELHYLGQRIVKDIAEHSDSGFVDKFIWMNKNKDRKKAAKRFRLYQYLRKQQYEIVINPRYRRDYNDMEDYLLRSTGAKINIGAKGYRGVKSLDKYDRHYTRVFDSPEMLFEFQWNRYFTERMLGREVKLQKPHIASSPLRLNLSSDKNYVVLFPGANADFRKWAPENFSKAGDHIATNFNYRIIVAGSPSDFPLGESIIQNSTCKAEYVNFCGKTSLRELVDLIAGAELLVSNETSAPHIAVAVSTPIVCISNGNHFGRFNPYPAEVFRHCHTVYPKEISESIPHNYKELVEKYGFGSDLDINTIQPDEVIFYIEKALNERGFNGIEKAI